MGTWEPATFAGSADTKQLNVHSHLGLREVIGQSRRDGVVGLQNRVVPAERGEHPGLAGLGEQQGVGLSGAVAVHGEGQGPIVVREGDAQGSHGVHVSNLVGPRQEIEGDVPGPGGSINEIGGSSERGDFREQAVDGGLQRDLQGREVPAGGEGPGALQREDRRVSGVQPGVLQSLARIVYGGLGDVPQQRLCEIARGLVAGALQRCNERLSRVEPPVSQCQRGVEGGLLDVGQQGGDDDGSDSDPRESE